MKNRKVESMKGVIILDIPKHRDERGFLVETYYDRKMRELGDFKQENLVYSTSRGTLRGLHFQVSCHAQAKLVSVISGAIKDIIVDLRQDSATFGKWASFFLLGANNSPNALLALFVPAGFAHGYITLEDETVVLYKMDNYYNQESEAGIRWNDPTLNIKWIFEDPIISEKDRKLPEFDPKRRYF